jgi:hypothetical protein
LTLEIGVGLRFFLGLILPALFGLDPRFVLLLHLRLDPVDGVLVGANNPHRRFAVPEDAVVQRKRQRKVVGAYLQRPLEDLVEREFIDPISEFVDRHGRFCLARQDVETQDCVWLRLGRLPDEVGHPLRVVG